ncbi:MAG: alcohol dehydrogenase catalytic domain-containing protein, partial [Prevotella pectinovora]
MEFGYSACSEKSASLIRIIDKGSDVKGYNIGDRVVIDNNVPCGHCEECQTGHYNTCLNMNG